MTRLFIPRQVQMSVPIVFFWSQKLGHIICPPHWSVPAPAGYEKIECRHAREVEIWSERLQRQEVRFHQMNLEQRFYFEEPIRQHMMEELKKNWRDATDPKNRAFLARAIDKISAKREQLRKDVIESWMHCEAKEGVAS